MFSCENEDGTFRKIGYTSDTAFHKDVVPIMCKAMKECAIIIENISGIYEDDILLKVMKEKHLGYYGCYKLIDEIHREPDNELRYVLLSEFIAFRCKAASFFTQQFCNLICHFIHIPFDFMPGNTILPNTFILYIPLKLLVTINL